MSWQDDAMAEEEDRERWFSDGDIQVSTLQKVPPYLYRKGGLTK